MASSAPSLLSTQEDGIEDADNQKILEAALAASQRSTQGRLAFEVADGAFVPPAVVDDDPAVLAPVPNSPGLEDGLPPEPIRKRQRRDPPAAAAAATAVAAAPAAAAPAPTSTASVAALTAREVAAAAHAAAHAAGTAAAAVAAVEAAVAALTPTPTQGDVVLPTPLAAPPPAAPIGPPTCALCWEVLNTKPYQIPSCVTLYCIGDAAPVGLVELDAAVYCGMTCHWWLDRHCGGKHAKCQEHGVQRPCRQALTALAFKGIAVKPKSADVQGTEVLFGLIDTPAPANLSATARRSHDLLVQHLRIMRDSPEFAYM